MSSHKRKHSEDPKGLVTEKHVELKAITPYQSAWLFDKVSYTASPLLLNGIGIGNDYDNRIGRQVHFKSIQMKLMLHPYDSTYLAYEGFSIRILVVLDKQSNGALPALTDVMSLGLTILNPVSLTNLNTRNRFQVLVDEVMDMPLCSISNNMYGGYTNYPILDLYRPLSITTTYSGSTSAISDIATNSIVLFAFGEKSAPADSIGIRLGGSVRLRYTDA